MERPHLTREEAKMMDFPMTKAYDSIKQGLDEALAFSKGNNTSAIEVTNISAHGFWILAHEKEFFPSYDDFPWFKDQTVKTILNVEEPSSGHFYWPDLDVDLSTKIIENPGRFPLKAIHS